jgi:hypothetical protein
MIERSLVGVVAEARTRMTMKANIIFFIFEKGIILNLRKI